MRIVAIIALAGCGFHSGGAAPSDGRVDGRPIDGPPDAPPDTGPRLCFGPATGPFSVCFTISQLPTGPKTIPGTVDSDSTADCLTPTPTAWTMAGQLDACFLVGNTVTVPGDTRITGTRPVVLVATDTLTINGNIDVSSKHNMTPGGAGNDPTAPCPGVNASTPQTSNGLGAGGAGGSFTTQGGNGGNSDSGNGNGGRAGNGMGTPALLRGGCPGADGAVLAGGAHGDGGGAIYLVAGNAITFVKASSWVNASGAGAQHGNHNSGGSGGGAGGMIALYAPAITFDQTILVANGGGGAGGGDNSNNGTDGKDPDPTMPTMAASGGGGANGGAGGAGYASLANAISGSNDSNGGGGGGGAGGYIRLNLNTTGATASPMIAVVP